MKKLLVSTLFLVVMTSLCTGLPFNIPMFQPSGTQSGGLSMSIQSQDLSLEVSSTVSKVNIGRDLILTFVLTNNQNHDIKNIAVGVYDNPCFTGESSMPVATLKANATKVWSWKFTPKSSVIMETSCPMRFNLSYDGNSYAYQDIAVLPQSEYIQRESDGTLSSVPIGGSVSNSPMNINMRFSEAQPFMDNQKYYLFVDYTLNGQGSIQNPVVKFVPPTNILLSCGTYLNANKEVTTLDFIRGKAASTTCNFTTPTLASMSIKTMEITATYKYILDNSITVTVSP
jgi:hypothetical protein